MCVEYGHASKRILVVDDDSAIRDAVANTLEDEGYEVSSAENGLQALNFLASRANWHGCVVVLDLMMPQMDGITFLLKLIELERRPPRVVVVTAAAPARSLPLNIPVLRKPFSLHQLLEAVERSCRRPELS